MIYDKLCNLNRYRGLSDFLDCVISFLQATNLSSLPSGRIELLDSHIYANHFSYDTAPFSGDDLFEDHLQHMDLHVVLSGREKIIVSSPEDLVRTEIRAQEDAVMYLGTNGNSLSLEPGCFLLVFPGEVHLPKISYGVPCHVDKLVIKISLLDMNGSKEALYQGTSGRKTRPCKNRPGAV